MVDPLIGRLVRPYRLVERIGAGGMGAVYRAVHEALDQPRAVKILPTVLAANPDFVARFAREAKLAARLHHPNIVSVYDVGSIDSIHYLAMALLPGRSLRELQRAEGLLPVERAIDLLRQLAAALDAAHTIGIVHRDVKPANAIVDSDDHLTLVDFGIARALEGTRLSGSALIGTPEYMAPELIKGEEPGPSVDHYALGIVAYELLTGQVPFSGSTTPAIMYGHVNTPPPPLVQVRPDLPPDVEKVVLRQLAKTPGDRYATAEAFIDALEQAFTSVVRSTHDSQALPKTERQTTPRWNERTHSSPSTASMPRARHDRVVLAIAVVMGLGALAFGLLLLTNPGVRNQFAKGVPTTPATTVGNPATPTNRESKDEVQLPDSRTSPPATSISSMLDPTSIPPNSEMPLAPTPTMLAPPLLSPPSTTQPTAPTATEAANRATGLTVIVNGTGASGVRLRGQPGNNGQTLDVIRENTPLVVIGPDRDVDGIVWRNVRAPNGTEGWIAASFVTTGGVAPVAPAQKPTETVPTAPTVGPTTAITGTAVIQGPREPAATVVGLPTQSETSPSTRAKGHIINTGGQGAYLRSLPGAVGQAIRILPEGALLELLGPEREVDGYIWKQVRDSQDTVGWVIAGAIGPGW